MMKKTGYRVLEALTGLILLAAVALTVTVLMQTSQKGYVTLNGSSMFKVVTGSMEPTIEVGALVVCKQQNIETIRVNDIVCFESTNPMMQGSVITHRVVGIDEIQGVIRLRTQGDANTVSDALYVTEQNLIGKVTWYSQEGDIMANVISFMNGKMGFLALVVLPVLVISALVMRESMRSIQEEIMELRRLERQAYLDEHKEMDDDDDLIERMKKEIREELGLSEPPEETEEELIARLKREIREELGLTDEPEEIS